MQQLRNIAIVLVLGFGASAFAAEGGGIFVEPGVTYQQTEGTVDYPAPLTNSDGEVKGFGLMARAGFHIQESIFLGADFRYSMPEFEDSANNYITDAVQHDWGPTVGFQMPVVGLRVWGAYIIESELDPESKDGLNVKFNKGSGWRVGAGFRVAVVSLNLEYQKIDYDRTVLEEVGRFSPGTNLDSVKYKSDGWIASVSFPLEL